MQSVHEELEEVQNAENCDQAQHSEVQYVECEDDDDDPMPDFDLALMQSEIMAHKERFKVMVELNPELKNHTFEIRAQHAKQFTIGSNDRKKSIALHHYAQNADKESQETEKVAKKVTVQPKSADNGNTSDNSNVTGEQAAPKNGNQQQQQQQAEEHAIALSPDGKQKAHNGQATDSEQKCQIPQAVSAFAQSPQSSTSARASDEEYPDFEEEIEVVPEGYGKGGSNVTHFNSQLNSQYQNMTMSVIQQSVKEEGIVSGYLMKKSPNFLLGWQKRYCEVRYGLFQYYKGNEKRRLKGTLNFNQVSAKIEEVRDQHNKIESFKIIVSGITRQFHFKASDANQTLDVWVDALKEQISASFGNKRTLKFYTNIKEFWRQQRISNAYFNSIADNGDVILFRGRSVMCKMLRGVIGSKYDHIALVLKRYSTEEIFVIESTSNRGVALFNWDNFVRMRLYDIYEMISVRQLSIERSDDFLDQLDEFIRFAIKKKYKIPYGRLFRKKASAKESSLSDNDRTFFCSELVAAAYKHLGVLPANISSSYYLPDKFEENCKDFVLKSGCSLSNEMIIDFSLP